MNTKQTEALKLALEGLEKWHFDKDPRGADQYITAIRKALAEQCVCGEPDTPGTHRTDGPCLAEQPAPSSHLTDEQKAANGLAWLARLEAMREEFAGLAEQAAQEEPVAWMDAEGDVYKQEPPDGWCPPHTPLYTSPPASKPWVGLTDEEVDECYYWKGRQWTTDELVRHVEAKLRGKNAQPSKPLTVQGWVWKDKRHEDCYVPSYTPAQHVERGELFALVDPADLHDPLSHTVWHTPSEAAHGIKKGDA